MRKSRNPTFGRKTILVIALRLSNNPAPVVEFESFEAEDFVLGICGMKIKTRIMLRRDPNAANNAAVCSLKKIKINKHWIFMKNFHWKNKMNA